jgi:4-amino-4-deoxychorismate lyase
MQLLAVLGKGVVDPATPVVQPDDQGLTRGDGCFEGIRIVREADGSAQVRKLDRHLARMARSAAGLGIQFDAGAWVDLVDQACAAWTGDVEGAMKLVLTRGGAAEGEPAGFLTISATNPDFPRQRAEGIRVVTLNRGYAANAFADAPWLLGGIKTLSYAVNMAAAREAEQRGVEDAIFVSADGYVLESTTGTVVWSHGRSLRTTPTGATGILAGTTQDLLFDDAARAGWDVGEQLITVDELHAADTVWVISSVRGPVDVISLDGVQRSRDHAVLEDIRARAGF